MKKILLLTIILASSLFATLTTEYASQKLLDSKIPIVDIRTPPEWQETGLIQGAIPIMFFNEQGGYDINAWLKELNEKVDTTKPFALICRTGSRTTVLAPFLSEKLGYQVINIKGGMVYAKAAKLNILPFKK